MSARYEEDMAAFLAAGGEKKKGLRALRSAKRKGKAMTTNPWVVAGVKSGIKVLTTVLGLMGFMKIHGCEDSLCHL